VKAALFTALMLAAVGAWPPSAAQARSKCLMCQDQCFGKLKRCERTKGMTKQRYGSGAGECKLACKASPACLGN
jgi:hypothetical protein